MIFLFPFIGQLAIDLIHPSDVFTDVLRLRIAVPNKGSVVDDANDSMPFDFREGVQNRIPGGAGDAVFSLDPPRIDVLASGSFGRFRHQTRSTKKRVNASYNYIFSFGSLSSCVGPDPSRLKTLYASLCACTRFEFEVAGARIHRKIESSVFMHKAAKPRTNKTGWVPILESAPSFLRRFHKRAKP